MKTYPAQLVIFALFSFAVALLFGGCGSDETGTATCEAGFDLNPITGECVPRTVVEPNGAPGDAGSPDDGPDDASSADGSTSDDAGTGSDTNTDTDMGAECIDDDRDGLCADVDCNDSEPAVGPGKPEVCDIFDNDCNGAVNDGIDCGFYAHTNEELVLIDPFAMTLEKVADTPTTLLDIDTHPDGRLFGILDNFTLATFDPQSKSWNPLPNGLGDVGNANGLAISNTGRVFITSSGNLYTADLTTGIASSIGSYSPYISSGDAVVTKGDNLLMTSSHLGLQDALIRLDGMTGSGMQRGPIGVMGIWGLTAAYGVLYGLTSAGQLVIIDELTGAGTIIHTFTGYSFYGAASTPSR